jgi:type III pantothenate kinase
VILLLDVGNSRIKWITWQNGHRLEYKAHPIWRLDELRTALASGRPDWVGISCVAGDPVRTDLAKLFESTGVVPFWLRPQAEAHGLVNRYERPESLGADRYAIAIAAVRRRLGPCVVVSAGTALTVDAIAGEGELLGGMIVPGVGLMRRALETGTAALAGAEGNWQAFPRATGDAVVTGIWTAMAASVMTMQARLSARLGRDVGVVVTGGDARPLAARLQDVGCSTGAHVIDNMVLEGLLWVARDLDVPGA